jgi:hypothetical protein
MLTAGVRRGGCGIMVMIVSFTDEGDGHCFPPMYSQKPAQRKHFHDFTWTAVTIVRTDLLRGASNFSNERTITVSLDGLKQGSDSMTVRHRPMFEPMRNVYCYIKGETTASWEGLGGEASKGDTHRSFK